MMEIVKEAMIVAAIGYGLYILGAIVLTVALWLHFKKATE